MNRALQRIIFGIGLLVGCSTDTEPSSDLRDGATVGKADQGGDGVPLPPIDAIEIEPVYPLLSGANVVRKRRFLWVPPGQRIEVSGTGTSARMWVPLGTRLWKEFYVRNGEGGNVLIERRMIERVAADQGHWGWDFRTSHRMEAASHSNVSGTRYIYGANLDDYAIAPNALASPRAYEGDQRVHFASGDVYIFPGQRGCVTCHSGAAGAYPGADVEPIMAFSLHPRNLTSNSTLSIVERGWMSSEAWNALDGVERPPTGDPTHNEFVGTLRNNCLSCHNQAPGAAARNSTFQLDPNALYDRATLESLLGSRRARTGGLLLNTQAPDRSELYRFVTGRGRRTMPPPEGGIGMEDPHLVQVFEAWLGI